MVYLPPPQFASAGEQSYAEAYQDILNSFRSAPLNAASSVIMLVAPDVDALCAARMLSDLFKQDDVIFRIIPVSGISELERIKEDLRDYTDLRSLLLINMGAILDLPSDEWFGYFDLRVKVHVIDSQRPQNLSSLFGGGENGERIVIWGDVKYDSMEPEREAWEGLTYNPEPDSDEDNESDFEDDLYARSEDEDDGYEEEEGRPRKRRSLGDGDRRGKRRRTDDQPLGGLSREKREEFAMRINKHYTGGTWFGQSASGTIYILATVLERVDPELLWLAILGLTYQYTTSRISRDVYDTYQSVYYDEVFRLHPTTNTADTKNALISLNPDDQSIRVSEELRFMLFRHWTLYDAMFHSSYIASKLGIWKERGRKKLTGLLAKMGFSILETQQPFYHMNMELKRDLVDRLEATAPEYGLLELSYPSFFRCYGYRLHPLSAADAVEGLAALLDVAGGVKMEVEIEGARNGGEWFGAGRVWELHDEGREYGKRRREDERENIPPGGPDAAAKKANGEEDDAEDKGVPWWVRNFWAAFDALGNIDRLHEALKLTMSLHRAIIRQGTSIIDKQDIRTMRSHHVVVLTQGPDLSLFAHPGVLARLALWLVDAVREKLPAGTGRGKRRSLPFVVACLNETAGTYIVVGVTAALSFGDVRKNEFGLQFLDAKERCNARTRHSTFDTSVIEINKADLNIFLTTLCEGPDLY
ncbi:CDC45-like protein [Schizophyllum commune Loenen D]|nr:CDC45-like protein [Schizophyllum commune Loenen D]